MPPGAAAPPPPPARGPGPGPAAASAPREPKGPGTYGGRRREGRCSEQGRRLLQGPPSRRRAMRERGAAGSGPAARPHGTSLASAPAWRDPPPEGGRPRPPGAQAPPRTLRPRPRDPRPDATPPRLRPLSGPHRARCHGGPASSGDWALRHFRQLLGRPPSRARSSDSGRGRLFRRSLPCLGSLSCCWCPASGS